MTTDAEGTCREEMCLWGRSMFERGLTPGSSGNFSVRLADGYLVTPTGSCLGFLQPGLLTKLDGDGRYVSGDRPTKEVPMHLAFYAARPAARAVVHLHSTYATALSCLEDIDAENALPAITPYSIMQFGRVRVVPYAPPGSEELAKLVAAAGHHHNALLLGNHGPIVAAGSLRSAVFAAEELEETARLVLITHGMRVRLLSTAAAAALSSPAVN
ncbi:MAG TPA: aldolase [Bauldia sp.]|nr:aldolase [Bauldia sp.]